MAGWVTTATFADRVNTLMHDFHVPGLSVAVLDGDTVYTRSFGKATIGSDIPVDANTIFDAASCSKALTGIAMGILIANHPKLSRLGWKTPVAELIEDDFVINRMGDTNLITVEGLLSHTSGFCGHDMSVLGINAAHPDNIRTITQNPRNLPSTARPGEKYQYSNIMYAVATHIIEILSGQTFSAFLHEKVFTPLGMGTTFLQPSEVYTAKLDSPFATPYYHENEEYLETGHQETPESQGAGSIQTTAGDYLKFVAAMLRHDKPPITKSIYDEVIRPRVMRNAKCSLEDFGPDSSEVAYALGWDIKYRSTQQIVTHDGVITGYGSRMFFLPGRSFGAVVMGNGQLCHRQNDTIGITIQLQDSGLYIDAADRSEPFTMVLEHVKDNTEFRGYITAEDGAGEDEMYLEFRLDAEDNVVAVGFNWEPALGSRYLFWHDRNFA